MRKIWAEMNLQIANYVRGKVIEIFIVGAVTYICFALLGVNYALLLGIAVGFSVVVPYIGAAVVTIPVAVIGFFQWGFTSEFYYLMGVYAVIQALDGNVLVPLLFSEAVNLHPIAIILAVLVFGGLWGFWGVFFAIPLATLFKAVVSAWPLAHKEMESEGEQS
jgi:putative permease